MLEKEVTISHETIYRYVWDDKIRGGICNFSKSPCIYDLMIQALPLITSGR